MGDYLEVSKEKNRDEGFGKEDVLSVSGEFGIVNQIEFQGRSFAGVHFALFGGRKCVLERSLCGA